MIKSKLQPNSFSGRSKLNRQVEVLLLWQYVLYFARRAEELATFGWTFFFQTVFSYSITCQLLVVVGKLPLVWVCCLKCYVKFPSSIIMVCDSFRVSIRNHLSCCSQWTYWHDYFTYNSVSIPTPGAVAGPHGQLASLWWVVSLWSFCNSTIQVLVNNVHMSIGWSRSIQNGDS